MLFAWDSHLLWVTQSEAARAVNVSCIAFWRALYDHADQEPSIVLVSGTYCLFVLESAGGET